MGLIRCSLHMLFASSWFDVDRILVAEQNIVHKHVPLHKYVLPNKNIDRFNRKNNHIKTKRQKRFY